MVWFEILFVVAVAVFILSLVLYDFVYDVGYFLFWVAVLMGTLAIAGQIWSWF